LNHGAHEEHGEKKKYLALSFVFFVFSVVQSFGFSGDGDRGRQ